MESGAIFVASIFGLFFGTIVLGVYLYAMHRAGLRLARRDAASRPIRNGVIAIAAVVFPISLWPFLTDWNGFLQIGFAMAFYILNAFPLAVGYGIGKDLRAAEARRRWRKNVDDWLGDWESEPARMVSDEDQDG